MSIIAVPLSCSRAFFNNVICFAYMIFFVALFRRHSLTVFADVVVDGNFSRFAFFSTLSRALGAFYVLYFFSVCINIHTFLFALLFLTLSLSVFSFNIRLVSWLIIVSLWFKIWFRYRNSLELLIKMSTQTLVFLGLVLRFAFSRSTIQLLRIKFFFPSVTRQNTWWIQDTLQHATNTLFQTELLNKNQNFEDKIINKLFFFFLLQNIDVRLIMVTNKISIPLESIDIDNSQTLFKEQNKR